jgi:hypothetical protein
LDHTTSKWISNILTVFVPKSKNFVDEQQIYLQIANWNTTASFLLTIHKFILDRFVLIMFFDNLLTISATNPQFMSWNWNSTIAEWNYDVSFPIILYEFSSALIPSNVYADTALYIQLFDNEQTFEDLELVVTYPKGKDVSFYTTAA